VQLQPRGAQVGARTSSHPPRPLPAAGVSRVACQAQQSDRVNWGAVAAAALSAVALVGAPLAADAVPQTSACATDPCDGQDLSNKDLRKEFYTKGSVKEANFSGSDLTNVTLFGANLQGACCCCC
jgi:hypothetical protein